MRLGCRFCRGDASGINHIKAEPQKLFVVEVINPIDLLQAQDRGITTSNFLYDSRSAEVEVAHGC